jgi:oxygen-independent coproporphyrinogen-3 oxidase
LLPVAEFRRLLTAIAGLFALDPEAEITAEANPETLTPAYLAQWRAAGINRLSLGLQSAVPHVLATLDRQHTPRRAFDAVVWARQAGFAQVSLDLMYGTPGESLEDWCSTLQAALSAGPDHVSAYSLIVEEGTRLAARLARGELPYPDDDLMADMYLAADRQLDRAGLPWYELSNWGEPCRHNLVYWRSADWWGAGAGAHSHIGGVRWWNLRQPNAYAARLLGPGNQVSGVIGQTGGKGQAGNSSAGQRPLSPAEAHEILTPAQRHVERILLELRLSSGLGSAVLRPAERVRALRLMADGLMAVATAGLPGMAPCQAGQAAVAVGELPTRLTLTRRGRLLADAVTRDLID